MPRIVLGLVAALAATSLTAGAQAGSGDPARVAGVHAPIRTLAQMGSQSAVVDTSGTGAVVPAPSPMPAANAVARLGGAPRSAPALARRSASPADAPLAPQTAKERRGMKYMLIGAGVLITGAIIDDDAGDIIMVGGVIISFYGLWIFLN